MKRALLAVVVAVVGVALGGILGRVLTCAADAGDLGEPVRVHPAIRALDAGRDR